MSHSNRSLAGLAGMRAAIVCLSLALSAGCGSTLKLKTVLTPAPADVPMFGKTASRVFVDSSLFVFPLAVAWEYDASAGFGNGSPVVVGNVLLTGTMQGELHAVDIITGKRINYVKNFSPISSSPAVYDRFVIVGMESTEENLTSIDTRSGEVRWSHDAGGVASSPLIKDSLLFVGGLDGTFSCWEAEFGTLRWSADTKSSIRSAPCAYDQRVYVATTGGEVFAYDIASGKVEWTFTSGNAVYAGLTVAENILYVGSRDSSMYLLDAVSGALLRKITVQDKIMSAPAVNEGTLFIPALDGTLSAFSVSDGSLLWKFQAQSAINVTPIVTPSAIFIASLDQHLYALSPADGQVLWKHQMESRIKTTPLVWNNSLIIAAEDKHIYCFRYLLSEEDD